MIVVVYLMCAIFLGLIFWQVFKIITGFGEKNCKVCGKISEQVVWINQGGNTIPVCGECSEKGEKND